MRSGAVKRARLGVELSNVGDVPAKARTRTHYGPSGMLHTCGTSYPHPSPSVIRFPRPGKRAVTQAKPSTPPGRGIGVSRKPPAPSPRPSAPPPPLSSRA